MDALLYRPLPYPQPQNLVVIWQVDQAHPDSLNAPPIAENVDWNKQNHVFDDISLSSFTDRAIVSGIGEPRPLHTQYVTPNFFDMLGAKPFLGRIFAADEQQDLSQTVVISTPFWKNEYHSDPHVLGKTMNIEGVVSTIVGVMPQGFAPFYGYPIDVWQPINPANPRYNARFDHWLMPVGRLKPGVTLAQAQADMDVIAHRLAQDYPATNKGLGDKVIPLQRDLYRGAGNALYPLLGAVAFVLLIACVNVANLMQFRTETRRKEYALRMSLGAERRRLVQQLLTESALLALAGGVLGTILTFVGIKVFLALADDFPNADSITVDRRVLLFALGISLLTAILFGLAPALRASNPDLNAVMREKRTQDDFGGQPLGAARPGDFRSSAVDGAARWRGIDDQHDLAFEASESRFRLPPPARRGLSTAGRRQISGTRSRRRHGKNLAHRHEFLYAPVGKRARAARRGIRGIDRRDADALLRGTLHIFDSRACRAFRG